MEHSKLGSGEGYLNPGKDFSANCGESSRLTQEYQQFEFLLIDG